VEDRHLGKPPDAGEPPDAGNAGEPGEPRNAGNAGEPIDAGSIAHADGARAAESPDPAAPSPSGVKDAIKREGRRLLGGTGAATATLDWGESRALQAEIALGFFECTPKGGPRN